MPHLDDLQIDHGPEHEPTETSRFTGSTVIAALALLVTVIGLGAWLVFRNPPPEPATARTTRPSASAEGPATESPLGVPVERVDLPALDLSDPFVRNLLRGLTSRPELVRWLSSDGLIRNFVVSVENVANGITPSRHLRRLAPTQPFLVHQRSSVTVVDRRSYERYDGLADTVAALDPHRLAQIYSMLKPRLQEAYAELGHPDSVDAAVERAIRRLLETPVLPPEVAVRPGGVTYKYEQPEIERLLPVQKQLLRMGPRNVQIVQRQLREIAHALGIKDERLPRPGRQGSAETS